MLCFCLDLLEEVLVGKHRLHHIGVIILGALYGTLTKPGHRFLNRTIYMYVYTDIYIYNMY